MYRRIEDGVFFSQKHGRVVEHRGYSTRIFWSKDMLDYLRRHFPTTLNEELAGCLGVSYRTLVRKARELGLEKDARWLSGVFDENRNLAHVISKRLGYPGRFPKGVRVSPGTEFRPGHTLTEEQKARKAENMRKWYRDHPIEAKRKAEKAAATRAARRKGNNDKSKSL